MGEAEDLGAVQGDISLVVLDDGSARGRVGHGRGPGMNSIHNGGREQ